jgi:anti-anti-sigma factor
MPRLCLSAVPGDTPCALPPAPRWGTRMIARSPPLAGAMPDPVFRVDVRAADTELKVELVGELDVSTAPELRRYLDQIVAADGDVLVDCCELTFADSSGLDTLIRMAKTLRGQGRRLVLTNVRPIVRRAIEVLQITDLVELE